MNLKDFVELVEKMRHAQKDYFRTKSNLEECKRLENRVDKACRTLRDGQKELFGDGYE